MRHALNEKTTKDCGEKKGLRAVWGRKEGISKEGSAIGAHH